MFYPATLDFNTLEEYHPDIKENLCLYQTIDDLITGGEKLKNNISKYLIKKPGEDIEVYNYRKKLFTYTPVIGQALNQLLNRLSASNYLVNGLPEKQDWSSILESLDGERMKEKEFIKQAFLRMLKYQCVFGIIEKPYSEIEPQNRKEEEELNLNPYIALYDHRQVVHYQEHNNKLQWVKLRNLICEYSPTGGNNTYLEWTFIDESKMVMYRCPVKVEDGKCTPKLNPDQDTGVFNVPKYNEIEHGRSSIPVVKAELPSTLWVVKEAIYLTLEHIRIHNNLTYTANVAGMIQRLFTPLRETADAPADIDGAKLQVGNERTLIGSSFSFNETTGSAISTVSGYADKLEDRIEDIIFSNGMSVNRDRPIQESGEAKKLDFTSQEQALISYGERLIDFVEECYRKMADAMGSNESEIKRISVSGLNEFILNTVEAKINRIEKLERLASPISEAVMKHVVSDLQRALTPNASTEEQAQIKRETEVNYEPDDFPELGINEVLSLFQNQVISEESIQEILGLDPQEESQRIKNQLEKKANLEGEINVILAEAQAEADSVSNAQSNQFEQVLLGVASYLGSLSDVSSDKVLEEAGYEPGLDLKALSVVLESVIGKISVITAVPKNIIMQSAFEGAVETEEVVRS